MHHQIDRAASKAVSECYAILLAAAARRRRRLATERAFEPRNASSKEPQDGKHEETKDDPND